MEMEAETISPKKPMIGQKDPIKNLTDLLQKSNIPSDMLIQKTEPLLSNLSYEQIKAYAKENLIDKKYRTTQQDILLEKLYTLAACVAKEENIILDDEDFFDEGVILALNRDSKDVGPWGYGSFTREETLRHMKGYRVTTDIISIRAEKHGKLTWSDTPLAEEETKKALDLLGIKHGEKVLDVGCGHGAFVYNACLRGAECTGVDYSIDLTNNLNAYFRSDSFPPGKAYFKRANVEALPFPSNSFDKIICWDLIEHINELQKRLCFSEMHRVLKIGGRALIATDNLNYYRLTLPLRRFRALLRLRNPFRVGIPVTPDGQLEGVGSHIGLTTPARTKGLLERNGFSIIDIYYSRHPRLDRYAKPLNRLFSEKCPLTRELASVHFSILCQKT